MNEIDKLKRAKLYMDKLSVGVDPNSGMRVHENDIVRDSRVIACFEYISRVLGWEIEAFENKAEIPESRGADVFLSMTTSLHSCSSITDSVRSAILPMR